MIDLRKRVNLNKPALRPSDRRHGDANLVVRFRK